MSNVLKNKWFTLPWDLTDAGHLRELSGSALKLYVLLFRLAQKYSAVKIEIPAYEIHDFARLDGECVIRGRKELVKAGLVTCEKGASGIVVYQLLDPQTGLPLPAPKGCRGIHLHRRRPGRSARTARMVKLKPTLVGGRSPSWNELGKGDDAQTPGMGKAKSVNRESQQRELANPTHSKLEGPDNTAVNQGHGSLNTSLSKGLSEGSSVVAGRVEVRRAGSEDSLPSRDVEVDMPEDYRKERIAIQTEYLTTERDTEFEFGWNSSQPRNDKSKLARNAQH